MNRAHKIAAASLVSLVIAALTAPTGAPVATAVDGTDTGAAARLDTSLNQSIVVVPHPDDEFQMWSLVENSPSNYKVFLVGTRGEQTNGCQPENFDRLQQPALGEIAPSPTPTGQWTESCADARMNSMLGFMTAMSEHDPSVPGAWSEPRDVGPFPANATELCRVDNGLQVCGDAQRSARVWHDTEGRGAIVSWDLGDGDLTADEVAWAVRTTIDERDELGLPHQRLHNLLGGFRNLKNGCHVYDHVDHRAVHSALWSENFGAQYHAAATCADDPDASRAETVTAGSASAAFALGDGGQRRGAHGMHYGWLNRSAHPLDNVGQDATFHTHQHFWIRRDGDLTG